MAIGDHRYTEARWRAVLASVIQSPEHRIKLVRQPQHAAETWGFCGGGLALLRILGSLEQVVGEETFQRGVDQALATLERHPETCIDVVRLVATLKRQVDGANILQDVADQLDTMVVRQKEDSA